jgi:protease II
MSYDRQWGFNKVQGSVYYRHQSAGEQHARLMRRNAHGLEDTLIGPARLSADGTTQLGSWAVSTDGQWLALQQDRLFRLRLSQYTEAPGSKCCSSKS